MNQSISFGTMHIELRLTTMLSQLVPKDRRWRLNIIVEERPFIKGHRDFKFQKELPKIMVLVSFQLSLPYQKHLEVIKVKVKQIWSICLTKYKLEISCPLNTRAFLMLLKFSYR